MYQQNIKESVIPLSPSISTSPITTSALPRRPSHAMSSKFRKQCWWPAMLGQLLVAVGDFDQRALAPRITQDLQAEWQLLGGAARAGSGARSPAHRHCDRRKSRGRREALTAVTGRRVEVADASRRVVPRGIDHGIEA